MASGNGVDRGTIDVGADRVGPAALVAGNG
jgi:hypothetical protein